MRFEYRGRILRMKLGTHVPSQRRNLDNLDQVGFRILSYEAHSLALEIPGKQVVELVAVPVAFHYGIDPSIGLPHPASGNKIAGIFPEPHGPTFHGDGLLSLHQVDDIMGGTRIHLDTVSIRVAKNIPGELYYHHLHPKADAESGDVVGAGILCRDYLPFYASLPEARTDHYAVHAFQPVMNIIPVDLLTVDENGFDLAVMERSGMGKTLRYALVSILKAIFPDQTDCQDRRSVLPPFQES